MCTSRHDDAGIVPVVTKRLVVPRSLEYTAMLSLWKAFSTVGIYNMLLLLSWLNREKNRSFDMNWVRNSLDLWRSSARHSKNKTLFLAYSPELYKAEIS